MSPSFAFLLGMTAGGAAVCLFVALLFFVSTSTPEMCLSSIAACLRGFAGKLDSLHVIVKVDGREVSIAFEQIARAIERAELSTEPCESGRTSGSGSSPEPGASSQQPAAIPPGVLH